MASKRDALASQLAARMQRAPTRGGGRPKAAETTAARPTAPRPPPAPTQKRSPPPPGPRPATTSRPSPSLTTERVTRSSPNGALRGHLVPHALHARARRAKTRAESQRGRRITWDEVAQEALDALGHEPRAIHRRLAELDATRRSDRGAPRLIQATIRRDQDAAFRELRLDLIEALDLEVTFEQLWSVALSKWVDDQG